MDAKTIAEHLRLAADDGFVAKCAAWADLSGVDAEAFRQRVMERAKGRVIMCGVRFYGGDTSRRFVELVADTKPGDGELDGVLADCLAAYAVLEPVAVRVFAKEKPTLPEGWHVAADTHLVTGTLADIAQHDSAGVVLEDVATEEDAATVAWIASRYAAVEDEALRRNISACVADDLAECRETGRACWWKLPGETRPAGLIAVRREADHGVDGFCVVEEVASDWAKGRGSAAQAQAALAGWLLDREPAETLIWGTIDDLNVASQKTAARAGRKVEKSWWFCYPPGVTRWV
ncbi:MAG: hypothetical protein AAGK78_03270 [Planctomycetota bacterium]